MKYIVWLFCLFPMAVSAQKQRDFLQYVFSAKALSQNLVKDNKWVNFPDYTNREAWAKIDPALKKALIKAAEKRLDYRYEFIPASSYQAFVKMGDRGIMERPYSQNYGAVQALLLGELLEGNGRFVPQIIKGIHNLCQMQTWALSAHLSLQGKGKGNTIDSSQHIIDLGAGRTGAILAWTYYFLHDALDKFSPGTSQKIVAELEKRIVEPYASRTDFWWMALHGQNLVNNWNVWCNYNVLTCVLLAEKDPVRKTALVYKTMTSVDKFLNYYKDDGACEEGPSYWSEAGGNLYSYLTLLKSATQNKVDIFAQPIVRNMAAYIYKVYIGNGYYVNFADAHPKIVPEAGLVHAFGKAVNDPTMQSFAAYLSANESFAPGDVFQTLCYLFDYAEIKRLPAKQPFLQNVAYPQTQVVAARDSAGTTNGFYFAAKGGNNAESHNHNDIGSCILYFNGYPVLIDIGSGTYTGQTFSSRRFELFNTRSLNHNVPLINGVEQHEGAVFAASGFNYKASPEGVQLCVGIEKAYPKSAGVIQWTRDYTLARGSSFSITDEYQLKKNNGACKDDFLTGILPQQIEDGKLGLDVNGTTIYLTYDPQVFHYKVVPIEITDPVLIHQWGERLYRMEFTFLPDVLSGKSTIVIRKAE